MNRNHVFGAETLPLLTAEEAAERDRIARDRHGVREGVLMENAGRSAALVLHRLYPAGRVVAVLGGGNNGGDGLVLLRTLRALGRDVAFVGSSSRSPDSDLAHGFEIPEIAPDEAEAAFMGAAVLVDGILGTGAEGAPREGAAKLIRAMNRSGRPILALDSPSGVNPTTGTVEGEAVRAAVTVAFGWAKQGLLFQPGRERCGRLVVVEIGFPPALAEPGGAAVLTPDFAAAHLARRSPDAHKGSAGRLLILAGSRGMAGAAVMAGAGGIRAGAGLVRIASERENRKILQIRLPEAIYMEPSSDAPQAVGGDTDAVVAGPGLTTASAAAEWLDHVLEATAGVATVLDADALNILADRPDDHTNAVRQLAGERPLVITPHPGEFARLSGRSIEEIIGDPIAAARELAESRGCVVLLKGLPSVVASPGEPVLVNSVGSSDLATAGMGDLLAGAIGAFLAGGMEPRTAAATGLFYVSRAADLAGKGRALTPMDVAETMGQAFADPGAAASPLEVPFVLFDQPPRR